MKQGVYDVLPSDALKGLTAEDLRLILCGTHEISIRLLQSYTSFADESSAPADQLARFKRWFWYVVSKLNAHDRQVRLFNVIIARCTRFDGCEIVVIFYYCTISMRAS